MRKFNSGPGCKVSHMHKSCGGQKEYTYLEHEMLNLKGVGVPMLDMGILKGPGPVHHPLGNGLRKWVPQAH